MNFVWDFVYYLIYGKFAGVLLIPLKYLYNVFAIEDILTRTPIKRRPLLIKITTGVGTLFHLRKQLWPCLRHKSEVSVFLAEEIVPLAGDAPRIFRRVAVQFSHFFFRGGRIIASPATKKRNKNAQRTIHTVDK